MDKKCKKLVLYEIVQIERNTLYYFLYNFKIFSSLIAEEKIDENEKKDEENEEEVQIDTFRVIGIRRSPGECLVRNYYAIFFFPFLFLQTF